MSRLDRRSFVKHSALGIGSVLGFGTRASPPVFGRDQDDTPATYPDRLRTRTLGRTGFEISEVSLGASPAPPEPVFRKALELGVNYIDTASTYQNGNSERAIGRMLRGRRDKVHVATKFHPDRRHRTRQALISEVEGSLRRLETDHVDVLLVHGAATPEILRNEEVLGAFDQLRKDGKILFTGTSCHRSPVEVLIPAIESGHYDVVNVAYNAYSGRSVKKGEIYEDYLERAGIEEVIDRAREHKVGVIAMKSMTGGDRQDLGKWRKAGLSLPQAKLKWVLQNPGIGAVITEMESFEMLAEDLAVCGVPMTDREKEALDELVHATSHDTCRLCGTCVGVCPAGIPIPDILRYLTYHQVHGKTTLARAAYGALPRSSTIGSCRGCEACEEACPHGVAVRHRLRRADRLLA